MKREIVIMVCDRGGTYHARYGKHTASATCSAAYSAARCAAKALGLCPSRKPADMSMHNYYLKVDGAANKIVIHRNGDNPNAYTAMHDDGA